MHRVSVIVPASTTVKDSTLQDGTGSRLPLQPDTAPTPSGARRPCSCPHSRRRRLQPQPRRNRSDSTGEGTPSRPLRKSGSDCRDRASSDPVGGSSKVHRWWSGLSPPVRESFDPRGWQMVAGEEEGALLGGGKDRLRADERGIRSTRLPPRESRR